MSVLYAAERSGGGEPAKPRAGACEPTQSAAESDPELRGYVSGLDGPGEGCDIGYPLRRSPSRLGRKAGL